MRHRLHDHAPPSLLLCAAAALYGCGSDDAVAPRTSPEAQGLQGDFSSAGFECPNGVPTVTIGEEGVWCAEGVDGVPRIELFGVPVSASTATAVIMPPDSGETVAVTEASGADPDAAIPPRAEGPEPSAGEPERGAAGPAPEKAETGDERPPASETSLASGAEPPVASSARAPTGEHVFPPSRPKLEGTDPQKGAGVPGYLEPRDGSVEGVTRTRVSDNEAFDLPNGKARHSYSKRSAWNRDETLLAVGGKLLDAQTYEIVMNFIPLSSERNWSNVDPNLMYGITYSPDPNVLSRLDVRTGEVETVRAFDEYEACSIGEAEGSLTYDDGRVVLTCEGGRASGREIVAYDIASDAVLGRAEARSDMNWAAFSPYGNWVLVENNDPNTSTDEELVRYDADMTDPVKLTDDRAHGDFGIDADGDEVYVMIDWEYVFYVRLEDGARVNLQVTKDGGASAGHGHLSCRNLDRPGWCYISSYDQGRAGAVRIGIANPEPVGETYGGRSLYEGFSEYQPWGYHRSSLDGYASTPKGTASPSGTSMIITSDWYGRGEINDYVFEYVQD